MVEYHGLSPLFVRARMEEFVKWAKMGDEILDQRIRQEISNKPKPFVKWVGGKRQLLKQFKELNLYPPDDFNPTKNTYYEPFVGGGAVFFDLRPQQAVISDLNLELITTYKVIKKDYKKLIAKLKEHQRKNSKEYFLKVRAQNLNRLKLELKDVFM